MQIRLTAKTDVENKGKYSQATVHYDQDGEAKERKVMSFAVPAVYTTLVNANVGDAFDIKAEKDGKFWKWVQCTPVGASGSPSSASESKPARGGWETPEERAMKQVYIIRQSCLSSAVNLVGPKGTVDDVLEAAKRFEAFVHGVQEEVEPEVD